MKKKIRSLRGETLTESLVSILIIALAAAMLATMVTTAVNINMRANEETAVMYEELTYAETGDTGDSGTVIINGDSFPVKYYKHSEGALTAYRKGGS